MESSHLKLGAGYPCAEHNTDKSLLDRFLYLALSASDENTGDFRPTGSINYTERFYYKCLTVPE